jgi:hypothetical protein
VRASPFTNSALAGLAAALLLASGCGPGGETVADAGPDAAQACKLDFLGDPSLEPVMEVIARGADGTSTPIEDGSPVALVFPPQGGRVVFAGVRATNIDACGATLTGVLRDRQNNKICIDFRTVNLAPYGDGWGGSRDSDISTFANIPVCPNQWSATSTFGNEYDLEMTLKDRDKERTVKKTLRVIPECAEPEHEAQCLCICKQGYILGETCEAAPSASTPPASPPPLPPSQSP